MKVTVPRYLAVSAVVYLIATAALLYYVGESEDGSGLHRIVKEWKLLLAGTAFGPFLSLVGMYSPYGNAGSIYFFPTVFHCFNFVFVLVMCLVGSYYR